jgi:hypothetical protein
MPEAAAASTALILELLKTIRHERCAAFKDSSAHSRNMFPAFRSARGKGSVLGKAWLSENAQDVCSRSPPGSRLLGGEDEIVLVTKMLQQVTGEAGRHLEFDVRIDSRELSQRARKDESRIIIHHRNAHGSRELLARKDTKRLVMQSDYSARVAEKFLASASKGEVLWRSIEQRLAGNLFKVPYLHADG